MNTVAIVLAAGAGSRFGGGKLLAPLAGRPVLQHTLDALAAVPLAGVVVVLGADAADIEAAIAWRGERRVRNDRPEDGLASSLRVGLDAIVEAYPDAAAVLVALGDQPSLDPAVATALIEAAASDAAGRPIVRPRYPHDDAPNPVLVRRAAWALAAGLEGDRGLGPLFGARPDLVFELPVGGANPDVDTRDQLRALELETAWNTQVRANRDQVDRFREIVDDTDFYAPVSRLFLADPDRTGDASLDLLRSLVSGGETWLDVGAGAGRYALPLARLAREVIALEPSPGMLGSLEEQRREHGITNVRTVQARWPVAQGSEAARALGPYPVADTALIAHVSYDVEPIGPFLDALEAAARNRCLALLMERQPSSIADVAWPIVHGEERVPLPALPELVALLRARGRSPLVTMLDREPRRFKDRVALATFLRRQLWIAPGGVKDDVFEAALHGLIDTNADGVYLRGPRPLAIGLVTWDVV